MEQPCYKCGQVVEEGRPFCPHCSAPLIRVLVAEPPASAEALSISAGARPQSDLPSSQTVPVLALPMRWSQTLRPCLLASLVSMGMIMLHLYPFVALLSGGFLAVVFYRQGRLNLPVSTASGAKLGALTGFLCFCIVAVLSAIGAAIPDVRAKMQSQIVENLQTLASSRPADPQIQALLDALKTPDGFVMMLIFMAIALLVVSVVLGVLGGAVGGKLLRGRNRS